MNIIQIYETFKTEHHCERYLEKIRWNGKPICPYCQGDKITKSKGLRNHCIPCNKKFSVTVGTIFHNTKCDLRKWFLAISTVINAKKGISAMQLSRELKINKNTAWYMLMRIRKAFNENVDYLQGVIQMDELFWGGKTKNKHKWQRDIMNKKGTGYVNKTPIFGMLQEGGKVVCFVMGNQPSQESLHPFIRGYVQKGSTIVTDGFGGYQGLENEYRHEVVNHKKDEFSKNGFHTNSIEGFWSILKRGIYGQFHQISQKWLGQYVNEFCFRYNNRNNSYIFELVISKSINL